MINIVAGSRFIIKKVPKRFVQRMVALGINRNAEIKISRIAPFNGLIQIELGNLNLGLRQDDLLQLELEPVE